MLVQGSILLAARNDTSRYFSWTIAVPVTAAFLGAGYLSAAVLEATAARQGSWERGQDRRAGVLAFTTLTLAVTLVHLGKFHLGVSAVLTRALTWGWLAIYAGVPPVLAYLWWRQARAVPGAAPTGTRLPPLLRAVLGLQGGMPTAARLPRSPSRPSSCTRRCSWLCWPVRPFDALGSGAGLVLLAVSGQLAGRRRGWPGYRGQAQLTTIAPTGG